jgi:very-short-patch-repair endonuclease
MREAWTLLELLDAGLPRPVAQHWVDVDGIPTYRLDFAYVEARVYIEYDGEEAHGSEEQVRHDRRRREWLRSNGWTGIIVRSGDFTGARRDRWVHELRSALASAYTTRRW